MKRSAFMVIAAILPVFFGVSMAFNPGQMLDMMAIPTNDSSRAILQWMACPLVAVGVMNFLARNDAGSPALRALMIGNILVHVLGMIVDIAQYQQGIIKMQGVAFGAVVHIVLTAGFAFYYSRLPRSA